MQRGKRHIIITIITEGRFAIIVIILSHIPPCPFTLPLPVSPPKKCPRLTLGPVRVPGRLLTPSWLSHIIDVIIHDFLSPSFPEHPAFFIYRHVLFMRTTLPRPLLPPTMSRAFFFLTWSFRINTTAVPHLRLSNPTSTPYSCATTVRSRIDEPDLVARKPKTGLTGTTGEPKKRKKEGTSLSGACLLSRNNYTTHSYARATVVQTDTPARGTHTNKTPPPGQTSRRLALHWFPRYVDAVIDFIRFESPNGIRSLAPKKRRRKEGLSTTPL